MCVYFKLVVNSLQTSLQQKGTGFITLTLTKSLNHFDRQNVLSLSFQLISQFLDKQLVSGSCYLFFVPTFSKTSYCNEGRNYL